MKAFFSKLGQTFMLPVALLPAAGIMLGVGGSFTNTDMISSYGLEAVLGSGTLLNNFLTILTAAGGIVFANLALMFAIALAVGFARTEKASAGFAAVMTFLVANVAIAQTLAIFELVDGNSLRLFGREFEGMITSVLGISGTLNMGVFGGMIAGGVAAFIHNRYINVKLPDFLGFFAGARLIPIISSFAALFYGMALVIIWPFLGAALGGVGDLLGGLVASGQGWLASFVFGIVERALIPFGLHHVFYLPLWQTSVGGTYLIGGQEIFGTQFAFFESLRVSDFSQFPSTNFMTGKFPFMMFGLPAAAFAMYTLADNKHKKEVGGLLFSVALTAFLTGITEPIEFTFLFLAPFLYYGLHVPLAGLSFMLMDILNVKVGMTFSGGIIDFTLFGLLPAISGVNNNWYFIPIIGVIYVPIYFFLFRWYILRNDLPTPGRGGADVVISSKQDYQTINEYNKQNTIGIIKALGGSSNISSVDACITRLRVGVKDGSLVKENNYWLANLHAKGVVISGNSVQVIYGAQAAIYKPLLEQELGLE